MTLSRLLLACLILAGDCSVSAPAPAPGILVGAVGTDSARIRTFQLPGSWQPMVLMMAIFCTRYVAGVVLALHPELTRDTATAALVASIYGALSGVFIGRMVCMLAAARSQQPAPANSAVSWG